jgi:hypothetical protein
LKICHEEKIGQRLPKLTEIFGCGGSKNNIKNGVDWSIENMYHHWLVGEFYLDI